jgi:hypothetical protein
VAAEDGQGRLQALRVLLAGGDEGLMKSLERYKSEEAIAKSWREGRAAAKNAGKPPTLPDKATEDDIKAFREAYGIPAEAKDYPVAFTDDFKASDADGEVLGSFKEYMHSANGDPRTAKAAVKWFQDFQTAQVQDMNARLAATAKETQAALRAEWGGEYDGNVGAAGEIMKAHLGDDGFKQMMEMRLIDGSRLQDHAPFVKMMAQIGTDYYGGNSIITGDVEATSKTIDERLGEFRKMQVEEPKKYQSPAVQEQVAKLYAQKEKIDARRQKA